MGLRKCPRCELNYIRDDQKLCEVCSRKHKLYEDDDDHDDLMCSECGEHPAMKGRDLCSYCYKESLRQEQLMKQHKHISDDDMSGVDDISVKSIGVSGIGVEDIDVDAIEDVALPGIDDIDVDIDSEIPFEDEAMALELQESIDDPEADADEKYDVSYSEGFETASDAELDELIYDGITDNGTAGDDEAGAVAAAVGRLETAGSQESSSESPAIAERIAKISGSTRKMVAGNAVGDADGEEKDVERVDISAQSIPGAACEDPKPKKKSRSTRRKTDEPGKVVDITSVGIAGSVYPMKAAGIEVGAIGALAQPVDPVMAQSEHAAGEPEKSLETTTVASARSTGTAAGEFEHTTETAVETLAQPGEPEKSLETTTVASAQPTGAAVGEFEHTTETAVETLTQSSGESEQASDTAAEASAQSDDIVLNTKSAKRACAANQRSDRKAKKAASEPTENMFDAIAAVNDDKYDIIETIAVGEKGESAKAIAADGAGEPHEDQEKQKKATKE